MNLPDCARRTVTRDIEEEHERSAQEFQPWLPRSAALEDEQAVIRDVLARRAGAVRFGKNSFVARSAHVHTDHLELGAGSWIAAGAVMRGHVTIGDDTSINPNAHVAGIVRIGSGVRIAGQASLYGFNHGHASVDIPIHRQPHTAIGIEIGDEVWIGANAVIIDGCRIGRHSIVAAGAVVTRSFPEYQIIAGNPARILRDRRGEGAPG